VSDAARSLTGERIRAHFERVASTALDEDLGGAGAEADVTTTATVPASTWAEADVLLKEDGVVAGLDALEATFGQLDPKVVVERRVSDGDHVAAGTVVATVRGPARTILVGERAALNVLGRLCGIATLVRAFADVAPDVSIVDTRKTTPGLRALEKYAVRCGGGSNHRSSLWDGVLVKDNHVAIAGGVGEATRRAKAATTMPVQVECTTVEEAEEAVRTGADAILLDNFDAATMQRAVEAVRALDADVLIEASGGITLRTLRGFAATGVDRISVGAFTHSAPASDVSLELRSTWEAD
jgi:nicotinate-nucleotide pyrophosphorylase (carboxylating)